MSNAAETTNKQFQMAVLGGLAAGIIILFGGVQLFLVTSTIQTAAFVLMLGMLLAIAYIALDL